MLEMVYVLLSIDIIVFVHVEFYFQLTTENNAYNSHAKTSEWIRVPPAVSKSLIAFCCCCFALFLWLYTVSYRFLLYLRLMKNNF